MANKELKDKKIKAKESEFSKFLSRKRSYLIGVVLGLVLIIVNTSIGLFLVQLVIDADNPEITNQQVEDLPVPEIDEESYTNFREDYLNRQTKELIELPQVDPFGTD